MDPRVEVRPLAPAAPDGDRAEEVSFLALLNMLLRSRRLLILLPLALALGVVAFKLLQPRTWTATTSFVPQNQAQARMGGLAGVAAQFGLPVPGESPAESPAFYAHLLTSPALLEEVVRSRYDVVIDGRREQRDLISFLVKNQPDSALAAEDALSRLRDRISVTRDAETGLVTVDVRTRSPDLSHLVARRLLEAVNVYNLGRRRAAADAQREFAEERVQQARTELRQAESTLQNFLTRNRLITNSPQLEFQRERLQREVTMRQEIYTSLTQTHEQARIEAVRDVPLITVVEQPRVPARPDRRGTVAAAGIALVAGLIVALLIALGRELLRRSRSWEDDDLAEYRRLRQDALADLRRPFRGLKRAHPKRARS